MRPILEYEVGMLATGDRLQGLCYCLMLATGDRLQGLCYYLSREDHNRKIMGRKKEQILRNILF